MKTVTCVIAAITTLLISNIALAQGAMSYGSCKTQRLVAFKYSAKPEAREISRLLTAGATLRPDRTLEQSNVVLFQVDSESACESLKQEAFEKLPQLLELPGSYELSGHSIVWTGEFIVYVKEGADLLMIKQQLKSLPRTLDIVSEPGSYDNWFVVRGSALAMNFEKESKMLSKISGVERVGPNVAFVDP